MRDIYSKPVFIGILLFVLSFALRLGLISKGAFSSDCLSITQQAERLLDTSTFHYHFGFGYPLTILLAALFVAIGRIFSVADAVMSVNFMSVVFGSLCIPLFYHVTRLLLDRTTAFLSAILLSLCPIFVSVSVFGIGHTPALFFLLLGLLQLIKFFHDRRMFLLILAALSFGACGAARIQDLILFMPALTAFFFLDQKIFPAAKPLTLSAKIRLFVLFAAVCLLVSFLFHLPYLLDKSRATYVNQLSYFKELSVANFTNIPQVRTGLFYNIMYLVQTLSILGVIISIVGLFLLGKERFPVFLFAAVWILPPFYFFCHLHGIVSRHQVLILPPFIMAQCYLFARLLALRSLFRISAFVIYLLVIVLTFGHYLPQFVYRHRHSLVTEYAVWLGTMTEPNARIIGTDIGAFIERYAHRQPQGRMLQDRYILSDEQLNNYRTELEGLLDEGIPLYITDTGLYVYDFRKRFSDFMKSSFEIEYVGTLVYEDWHRDYLQFIVFQNALYRIKKK